MDELIEKKLKENQAFCILPWVHVQVRQNGEVQPCCRQKGNFSYGNASENSLTTIWNSEKIKNVRKEMLAGIQQKFCSDCFKSEQVGQKSYRDGVNEQFKNQYSRIKQTEDSGQLNNEQIPYLDIRFSNICNFKCRTCNSDNSTSWQKDEVLLNQSDLDVSAQKTDVKVEKLNSKVLSELYDRIPFLEYLYFAGGEPLIDKNHYLFLEKLIECNQTDIIVNYNTNLSTLSFQKWNVLTLWQKFKKLRISVSIDATENEFELIRKGSSWKTTQLNLKLIQLFVPHALIDIYPTVSVLNCFHLPKLIDFFLKNDSIQITKNITFNLLNDPSFLNIGVLNESEIEKLSLVYQNYLTKIRNEFSVEIVSYLESELNSIIQYARSQNLENQRKVLTSFTKKLDSIRNESSESLFKDIDLKFNEYV